MASKVFMLGFSLLVEEHYRREKNVTDLAPHIVAQIELKRSRELSKTVHERMKESA